MREAATELVNTKRACNGSRAAILVLIGLAVLALWPALWWLATRFRVRGLET